VSSKSTYKEVNEVLKFLKPKELEKIPEDVLKLIRSTAETEDAEVKIDLSIPLDEQLSRGAMSIISFLFNDYILSDNQKTEFNKLLDENQKKKQEALERKEQEAKLKQEQKEEKEQKEQEKQEDNNQALAKINPIKKFFNNLMNLFKRK
jgi:hypothetical protein